MTDLSIEVRGDWNTEDAGVDDMLDLLDNAEIKTSFKQVNGMIAQAFNVDTGERIGYLSCLEAMLESREYRAARRVSIHENKPKENYFSPEEGFIHHFIDYARKNGFTLGKEYPNRFSPGGQTFMEISVSELSSLVYTFVKKEKNDTQM